MNNGVKNVPQSSNLNSRRIEILLEDLLGCRWTFAVLRAVAEGVHRPGALKRTIKGISGKVLNERLRRFTDVGLFERVQFPEIPPRVEYYLTDFGEKFRWLLEEVQKLQVEMDSELQHASTISSCISRSNQGWNSRSIPRGVPPTA
jgi:DNA-binding HxlR family transcriptional regulator